MRHRRFSSTLWRVTGLLVIGALGLLWRAARRPGSVEPEPFPPVPPRPGATDPRGADPRGAEPAAADAVPADRADDPDPGDPAPPAGPQRPTRPADGARSGAGEEPAPTTRPTGLVEGETPPAARRPPGDTSAAWVGPDPSGGCPAGFPVKVKLSSGLYHEPGAAAYGRTRPDRCYRDAAAARADGFRPARH